MKFLFFSIFFILQNQTVFSKEEKANSVRSSQKAKISLADAKKHAQNLNFEIKQLESLLEAAKHKKRKVFSAFYPEFGIEGGIQEDRLADQSTTNSIGYLYGKWNLFRGLADMNHYEIASLEEEIAKENLRFKEFEVGLDVEEHYHSYVYFKRLKEVVLEALEFNDKHLKTVRTRRAAGLNSDADLMEFTLNDAILKSELVSLDQSLEESRVNLKKILGEEIGTTIEPIGQLSHEHIVKDLKFYLNAVDDNKSVTIANKELSIATAERKLNSSKWLPEVDLEVRTGRLPEEVVGSINSKQESTSILLVGRLPIFQGLESLYDRKERVARRESQSLNLKNNILNSISNVETHYRKLLSIEQRADLEFQNSAMAKKYYSAVLSEYNRGVKNSADLKNASENYFNTQKKEESLKYDFLMERIAMERVIGRSAETQTIIGNHPIKINK